MKRIVLIISLILIFSNNAFSQRFLSSIKGKVVDSKTKQPLPGVNIQIQGTYLGGSTNIHGNYELNKIPLKTCILHFSMIGYKIKEVPDIELELGIVYEVPTVELESTVIGMNPIVVTASKQRQDLSVIPHSISVLPEIELINRIPLRLDNALESIAGVHFVENHINIRGSSGYTRGVGSRVLLVIDEVPMMNSDNNEINWNILPILDIEQIEVIKGAGSALYGSNALGGVVNVITKSPSDVTRIKIRTVNGVYSKPRNAKVNVQNFNGVETDYPIIEWKTTNRPLNFSKNDISFSRRFGGLGLNFSLGYHKSTGYRIGDDFTRFNVSTKALYQFPDASKLTVYTGFSHEDRGEFIEWQDSHNPFIQSWFFNDARIKLNAFDTYLLYKKPITARASVKFRTSFISSLHGDQHNRAGDYNPAHGFGSEMKIDWLPNTKHSLTFGTEFKIDGGHSKYIGGEHIGFSVAPYFQDQWNVLDNMIATFGVRYDDYWLKVSDYHENYLNPKLGINYNPFENTILRLSVGSGFRAASILERFLKWDYKSYSVRPNPDLTSETTWSSDVGIRQQITNNWWVDMAVFNNRYFNYIEPQGKMISVDTLRVQFKNVADARIRGVEIATKGSMFNEHFTLQANITIMDTKDLNSKSPLAYRPKTLAFLASSLKFDPIEFQAEYRYASKIDSVMLFPDDQRVAQKIWTFRTFYRLNNFTCILAVNNAFNYMYTQLERNIKEPRNITFTFMYDL